MPGTLKNIRLPFVITLRVTLLMVLGSELGFLLALKQDLPVTLVWPPSGIALAAYFIRGEQALPGIFIGALLAALLRFHSIPSLDLLSIILVGTPAVTLSTVVAGQLLRHVSPGAPIWGSAREILLGFLCMGVACAIPAVLMTYNFFFLGLISLDVIPSRMAIYWLGELCGMLVFTTPAYLVGHWLFRKSLQSEKLPGNLSPSLLNSAVCAAAVLVFMLLHALETSNIQDDLNRTSSIATDDLKAELQSASRDLESIRALSIAHSRIEEEEEEEEFLFFTTTEFSQRQEYFTAQAIGFAPRITDPRAWEMQMHNRGKAGRVLFQVAGDGSRMSATGRTDYFPVQHIYPLDEQNAAAIGFDLGSEKLRRAAIERARDTGELSLVAPIDIVQSERNVAGMLMCWPVYRPGAPLATLADRRAAFLGVASGVYQLDKFLDIAISDIDPAVSLHLLEVSKPGQAKWHHTRPALTRENGDSLVSNPPLERLVGKLHGQSTLEFAGLRWLVVVTPEPIYLRSRRNWTPWIMLALILTLGVGLSSIMVERIVANRKLEEEQGRTEDALREARAANESKSYFMAAASHDIKQPLYALGMLIDTLQMSDPPEETRHVIKHLQTSVREMSQHFDTLMDVGRFQTGSFEVRRAKFNLAELARRINLEIAPLCREQHLGWIIDFDEIEVVSDSELLLRLIRNLLINAVRYTEHGEVRCSAKQKGRQVEFRISDTGPGLPAEQQQVIYADPEQQEDEGFQSTGPGMGLSIVNRISHALGVDIQVDTIPGRGTTFSFRLDLIFSG